MKLLLTSLLPLLLPQFAAAAANAVPAVIAAARCHRCCCDISANVAASVLAAARHHCCNFCRCCTVPLALLLLHIATAAIFAIAVHHH